ncbi:hypothetical protein PISL3812_09192 [Talaromyces islandicus]|uniref:Aflatoxin regulatory protein domain-containing protein n=1 Tax=Talaromyces islandicus TaxID=28573 RepID=A0A0U1MB18_TALIS|nr:hypothetical protein PISL3812_09192 [Talaromyces islandicus]
MPQYDGNHVPRRPKSVIAAMPVLYPKFDVPKRSQHAHDARNEESPASTLSQNVLAESESKVATHAIRWSSSLAILHLNPSSAEPGNLSGTIEFSSYIDVLADFMTPVEQSPSPRLSGISDDFDGNITPPMDFLELGSLDSHLAHFAQEPYDIEGLLTSTDIDSGPSFGNPSTGNTLPSKSFFPTSEGQQVLATNGNENFSRKISEPRLTCCCIVQALDIMSKLFIPDTPFSASISASPSDAATISNNSAGDNIGHSSAQALVNQNRQFIEAVDGILQCSLCVESSYLVTILSTIISKILERYTEAARQYPGYLIFEEYEGTPSSSGRRNTTTKEYTGYFGTCSGSHDDDARRATARLILGELHRVQGLMNRLSLRQNTPMGDTGQKDVNFGTNFPVFSSSDSQRTASGVAFSAATLGEMKTDLRKNLTTLSFGIIKMLRES